MPHCHVSSSAIIWTLFKLFVGFYFLISVAVITVVRVFYKRLVFVSSSVTFKYQSLIFWTWRLAVSQTSSHNVHTKVLHWFASVCITQSCHWVIFVSDELWNCTVWSYARLIYLESFDCDITIDIRRCNLHATCALRRDSHRTTAVVTVKLCAFGHRLSYYYIHTVVFP